MTPAELQEIGEAVKEMVVEIDPDTQLLPKYGGDVFAPDPSAPKAIVGGVFAYKDHISVEFSNGVGFADPDGHLEGKGKARRHLKLHRLADIEGKTLHAFLEQALAR